MSKNQFAKLQERDAALSDRVLEVIADVVKSGSDEDLGKQGYEIDSIPLSDDEEGRLLTTHLKSTSQSGMFRPLGIAFVRRELEEHPEIVIIGVFVGEEGQENKIPKKRKPRQ